MDAAGPCAARTYDVVMPLEISPLRVADAEILGPLQKHLLEVAYAGLVSPTVSVAASPRPLTKRWLVQAREHQATGASAKGGRTLVARDSAAGPIGWITVGPARDERAPAPSELWSIHVSEHFWGRGVARRLLEDGLGDEPAYVWLLAGNDRAQAFYAKHGFTADGATRERPDLGASELRMTRFSP